MRGDNTLLQADAQFFEAGRNTIRLALVGAVAILLIGIIVAPNVAAFSPLAVGAVIVLVTLWRHPLSHLAFVLVGFVLLLAQTPGLQIHEIAYGLYFYAYVAAWLGRRLILQDVPLIRTRLDALVAVFILYAASTFFLGLVAGADLVAALRQLASLGVVAIYFPIKEAIRSSDKGLTVVLASFVIICLFILIRNVLWYYEGLQSAERAFEIMYNRRRMNERFLMIAFFGTISFYLLHGTRRGKILALVLSASFLAGIIVGLSRTVWVAVALGTGIIYLVLRRGERHRLRNVMFVAFGSVAVLGLLVAGDYFFLIVQGAIDRIASLGDATERDISLINRFYEWRTAWTAIAKSPIVGYGFGVPYDYYDAIYKVTHEKLFIHSTYLGIWYRHGIIGLILFVYILLYTIWRGITIFRRSGQRLSTSHRAAVLGATASLVALMLAASMESIMLPNDAVFSLFVPIAVIAAADDLLGDADQSTRGTKGCASDV